MPEKMKYVIIVGDGMADNPIQSLGGRTPLMVARTPHMDWMAKQGEIGLVRTIPDGFNPGSEIANLSIFGYDPIRYYTGRGPLEAASLGVKLASDDIAFRCNLGKMCRAEYLVAFRYRPEFCPDAFRCLPTDTRINLIKDHHRYLVKSREYALQREHDT